MHCMADIALTIFVVAKRLVTHFSLTLDNSWVHKLMTEPLKFGIAHEDPIRENDIRETFRSAALIFTR